MLTLERYNVILVLWLRLDGRKIFVSFIEINTPLWYNGKGIWKGVK